jgi:AAA family ATP:ADP antiporter
MSDAIHRTGFERLLSLFTSVRAGEGRCVALLCLQAFLLMVAYYLIRPVREALILTEGDPELRSYAVGVQALMLILIIPAYGVMIRHVNPGRVYQRVNAFFVLNLLVFFLLGQAGYRFGFVFFVWASIFAVMAVTQFWAFATDLFNTHSGQRLFGIIAVGVSAGAWAGSRLAAAGFESCGPYGLMLASAAVLCIVIALSSRARERVPAPARADEGQACEPGVGRATRWLGGFVMIGRSRYLVGVAALVVLINWITTTGDYVLSGWLVEVAAREAPGAQGVFIGRFMGEFCSMIALVGFLVQLLLVSRIILAAGLARALMVTPVVLVGGFLLLGIMPVFLLLQSVLVIQRSLDYIAAQHDPQCAPAAREPRGEVPGEDRHRHLFLPHGRPALDALDIRRREAVRPGLPAVRLDDPRALHHDGAGRVAGRPRVRAPLRDRGRFRFRWRAGRRRTHGTRAVAGRAA